MSIIANGTEITAIKVAELEHKNRVTLTIENGYLRSIDLNNPLNYKFSLYWNTAAPPTWATDGSLPSYTATNYVSSVYALYTDSVNVDPGVTHKGAYVQIPNGVYIKPYYNHHVCGFHQYTKANNYTGKIIIDLEVFENFKINYSEKVAYKPRQLGIIPSGLVNPPFINIGERRRGVSLPNGVILLNNDDTITIHSYEADKSEITPIVNYRNYNYYLYWYPKQKVASKRVEPFSGPSFIDDAQGTTGGVSLSFTDDGNCFTFNCEHAVSTFKDIDSDVDRVIVTDTRLKQTTIINL